MSKITSDDPRPARGRKRQAEFGAELKKAVQINSTIMLAGLGREHTIAERFVAEAICALFYRASRLRDSGRDDVAVLRQAVELQQGSVFACRYGIARPMPTLPMPTLPLPPIEPRAE